jgi:hypothetical protein
MGDGLTGGRISPARNVQEAVDGEVSVVGDDGGVADEERTETADSRV